MSKRVPAWAKESMFLQMPDVEALEVLSPEWALAGATGEGVRVAVVDSGIDADHPMLEGCVDVHGAVDFAMDDEGSVVVTEGPHGDVFGHGTACGGIIHALAPKATITSVRVLGPGLRGKAAAFHAGLQWAVENEFDVINLSLGAGKRDWALSFHEVCDRAYFANSFIVTAANNMKRASFPSLYAAVTSVACNTTTDPLRFHFNPEPPTEFLARGIDVEVPWLNSETTVTTGNSFAAPHIAGFAALIKSKHPQLRPFHVKAALWACSANVRSEDVGLEAAGRVVRPQGGVGRGTMHGLVAPASLPDTPMVPPPPPLPDMDEAFEDDPLMRPVRPRRALQPAPGEVRPTDAATAPSVRELAEASEALEGIEVDGLLSRGSWGPVYEGRRADGTLVAIRRVDHSLAHDPRLVDRFVHSVQAAAEIDHPHVLPVDQLLDCGTHAWIVMPRCPTNLQDIGAPVDIVDAILAGMSLAAGLDAAHRQGVFHGDLRPRNALVDSRGRVVTSDSGIAAPLQSVGTSTIAVDAHRWMHQAPEQILGQAVGATTDVYAVGSVLYWLLTGTGPYPLATNLGQLIESAASPQMPQALPASLPAAFSAVITSAVATDPADRPASAAALFHALMSAADASLGDGWMASSRYELGIAVG